jgi:hypothetical protein
MHAPGTVTNVRAVAVFAIDENGRAFAELLDGNREAAVNVSFLAVITKLSPRVVVRV